MGDMTKNFSRKEFACRGENCCDHSAPISDNLVFIAQEIRDRIGSSMSPTCGYRCLVHNRTVGSNDFSKHPLGWAADFPAPERFTLDEFYAICCDTLDEMLQNGGGCAIYPKRGIVHVDVRPDTKWRDRNET